MRETTQERVHQLRRAFVGGHWWYAVIAAVLVTLAMAECRRAENGRYRLNSDGIMYDSRTGQRKFDWNSR